MKRILAIMLAAGLAMPVYAADAKKADKPAAAKKADAKKADAKKAKKPAQKKKPLNTKTPPGKAIK